MSNQRGATKGYHVTKRHTTLELIWGYDYTPGVEHQAVDLNVCGGARIRKTLCANDLQVRRVSSHGSTKPSPGCLNIYFVIFFDQAGFWWTFFNKNSKRKRAFL